MKNRSRAATSLAVFLTVTLSVGSADVVLAHESRAVAAGPSAPAAPDTGTAARDASETARRTGARVEVAALRGETEEVIANPSGTFSLRQQVRPVRVRQGAGWRPVDTTLRRLPDGSIAPVAVSASLRFSGGGTAPLARIGWQGRDIEFGWPQELPAPVLDADTATYPEVLPDVDLVLRAEADGFSEVLVVKSAAAARDPRLRTLRFTSRGRGVAAHVDEAGNLSYRDASGQVAFHSGTAMMWDSSGAAATSKREMVAGPAVAGRQRAVRLRVEAASAGTAPTSRASTDDGTTEEQVLALTPEQDLLTGADTVFPVYIDPNIRVAGAKQAWAYVMKAYASGSYYNSSSDARVGHEDTTNGTARSFFQMNTTAVRGKTIISATLRTFEVHSWSCSARPVEVWQTGAISAKTTWNAQPAWSAKLATLNVAKGYSSSCPDGGVDFPVTAAVVRAAAANATSVTFGLRASNETDAYGWKRFRNNPTLEIEYNTVPASVTNLSLAPNLPCTTGASRAMVGSSTATLRAQITDVDPQSVGARFEWYTLDGTKLGEYATPKVASGAIHSYPVAGLPEGTYRWRVRGEDTGTAGNLGAWSGFCEFGVDRTAPQDTPLVSSPTYPETRPAGDIVFGGGVGVAGGFTFTASAVDSDVVAFEWSLNVQPPTTWASAASVGGAATVTVTPTTDLLNTLFVRAVDAAGNRGPTFEYQFYVRPAGLPDGESRPAVTDAVASAAVGSRVTGEMA